MNEMWEVLICGTKPILGSAFSLDIHRVTGSKEDVTLLHHCGVGTSYTAVRELNNMWSKDLSFDHRNILPPGFVIGSSIHVAFDNNDGTEGNKH